MITPRFYKHLGHTEMIEDQRKIYTVLNTVKAIIHGAVQEAYAHQQDEVIQLCNAPEKIINAVMINNSILIHSDHINDFNREIRNRINDNAEVYLLTAAQIEAGYATQLRLIDQQRKKDMLHISQYLNTLCAACYSIGDLRQVLPASLFARLDIAFTPPNLNQDIVITDDIIHAIETTHPEGFKLFKRFLLKDLIKN